MNKYRPQISKTIRQFSIIMFFIGILVCSTIPVQAEFDSETPFTKGVLLNKPDIKYDLSQLERFDNIYTDKHYNIQVTDTFGIGPDSGYSPALGSTYIYRSHYNFDLGVMVFEINPAFFSGNEEDLEINGLTGLVVNIVIPTKTEAIFTEWEEANLQLFYDVEILEEIIGFMEGLGYNDDGGGGTFGDFTGYYFSKGKISVTIASVQRADPGSGPEPPVEEANFTLNVDGPKSEFNTVIDEDMKSLLEFLSVDLAEWDNATRYNYEWQDWVLVPGVPIDPETLDWGTAIKTELRWLINQSVITGLTDNDLQQIETTARTQDTGSYNLIYYSNGIWFPYLLLGGGSTFGDGPFQLYPADLPDELPRRFPEKASDEFPYSTFGIIGAIIALVVIVTFSYTRLKRRSILDNLNRKNIFEHIKANPGIHFKQLLRDLNFQPGAMSYHLNVLEKGEFIKSIQDSNYRRFYLYGTASDFKIALTTIQLRILSVVNERPGISQSNISKTIGRNRMVVNYHIKILTDAGVLTLEKSGRESQCYTTSTAAQYLGS